jgi:hypothetical protein
MSIKKSKFYSPDDFFGSVEDIQLLYDLAHVTTCTSVAQYLSTYKLEFHKILGAEIMSALDVYNGSNILFALVQSNTYKSMDNVIKSAFQRNAMYSLSSMRLGFQSANKLIEITKNFKEKVTDSINLINFCIIKCLVLNNSPSCRDMDDSLTDISNMGTFMFSIQDNTSSGYKQTSIENLVSPDLPMCFYFFIFLLKNYSHFSIYLERERDTNKRFFKVMSLLMPQIEVYFRAIHNISYQPMDLRISEKKAEELKKKLTNDTFDAGIETFPYLFLFLTKQDVHEAIHISFNEGEGFNREEQVYDAFSEDLFPNDYPITPQQYREIKREIEEKREREMGKSSAKSSSSKSSSKSAKRSNKGSDRLSIKSSSSSGSLSYK